MTTAVSNLQKIDLIDSSMMSLLSIGSSSPVSLSAAQGHRFHVRVDPEQIKIVLKNVLDNAIKYSPEDSQAVRISIDAKDGWVVIEIEDNGIGIEPEVLTYIWEPFYREDKSRSRDTGGYGLGLSLCKTIIQAHGGNIDLRSIPGKGTTVSLALPFKT